MNGVVVLLIVGAAFFLALIGIPIGAKILGKDLTPGWVMEEVTGSRLDALDTSAITWRAKKADSMETKLNPNPKPSLEEVYRAALRFALAFAFFLAVAYFTHGHSYGDAAAIGAAIAPVRSVKALLALACQRYDPQTVALMAAATVIGAIVTLCMIFL